MDNEVFKTDIDNLSVTFDHETDGTFSVLISGENIELSIDNAEAFASEFTGAIGSAKAAAATLNARRTLKFDREKRLEQLEAWSADQETKGVPLEERDTAQQQALDHLRTLKLTDEL